MDPKFLGFNFSFFRSSDGEPLLVKSRNTPAC